MMTLTVGSQLIGKVIDVDYKGQGVIKHEGYVIFVPKLLIGELAKVEITTMKKSFCQAKIIEITQKSEHRVHDEVSLDALDLYHMSLDEQLRWQEHITKDTFKKIANLDVDLNETLHDDRDVYYRNKSVFHVIQGNVLKLGLYDETKNALIGVDRYILSDKVTNKVLKFISDKAFNISRNSLTHVVFRTNLNGQILITFVSKNELVRGIDQIVESLSSMDEVVGITLNINRNHKVILGKDSRILYGGNLITERLNNLDIPISDQAFFQINLPLVTKAYDIIKKDLKPTDIVLDAYSGIGSIGYYIYDQVKKVIMVESNEQNIILAKQVKERYQIKNVDINHERAEKFSTDKTIHKVICDPPRNGLMPEFVGMLQKLKPIKIYYLSCDVKTLARDISILEELYEIENIYPIRMFYHTTSLETLVILKRK